MQSEELVDRYIVAWNSRDLDGLLGLLHPGAAYYDAFWMETCVGRDLAQYFLDSFDEEPYWFRRIGQVIPTDNGLVFRYSAHTGENPTADNFLYAGADAFTLQGDSIITISDFYCNPELEALEEVAQLVVRRHGVPNHTRFGLGARRAMRLRNKLLTLLERDEKQLQSTLTVAQLAARIGCPAGQLLRVIDAEYGSNLESLERSYSDIYAADFLTAAGSRAQRR